MFGDPIYTFYLYGLTTSSYAHHEVNGILVSDETGDTLATEALISLAIWMYAIHLLQNSVAVCKEKEQSDMSARSLFNNDLGKHAADEAAALWIGSGQVAGSSEDGTLLYRLAEEMAERFGTKSNGQAKSNAALLGMLRSKNSIMSFHNSCFPGSQTYRQVRVLLDKIVVQMTIPLIQSLIYYLSINDSRRIRVYAMAALPRVASCNKNAFDQFLKPTLIDGTYESSTFPEVMKALQDVYYCLGITCSDIGGFDQETRKCIDPAINAALAGYIPLTDVREVSLLVVFYVITPLSLMMRSNFPCNIFFTT